jgi:Outer membrane protein beta-barrel domain
MTLMRISIILLALFIVYSSATAQVKLGIEAGPDISRIFNAGYNYTSNDVIVPYNTGSRTGFAGGVFADVSIGDLFLFRPKILYTMGGGEQPAVLDYNGNLVQPSAKITMNYINVPLQVLYSPTLKMGRPWVGLGFYTAMMFGGTLNAAGQSRSLHLGGSSTDDFERWDFGFNPTAGLTLKNGVMIGVDYQVGMVHISVPPVGGYGPRPNSRNSIWSFHVGYEWKVKSKASIEEQP